MDGEQAAFEDARTASTDRLADLLGGAREEVVRIPHDCEDGFAAACWRRPHAYLDPGVRAGISLFSQADAAAVEPGWRMPLVTMLCFMPEARKQGADRARPTGVVDCMAEEMGVLGKC